MLVAAHAIGAASAWTPGELRPLDVGAAVDVAAVSAWDGGPALFVAAPDGVRVLDLGSGSPIGSAPAPVRARLLVHDLDGDGEPEIVACSAAGLELLRGSRDALAPSRSLGEAPCDAVVAEVHADWPRLVSIGTGRLTRWEPTALGLSRSDLDVTPADPPRLAAAGRAIATVLADGRPYTSDGGIGESPGP